MIFRLTIFKKLYLPLGILFFCAYSFALPPNTVWRADSRPPEIIFHEGFTSWGSNLDFGQHISGMSCFEHTSAFISTSANQSFANSWARDEFMATGTAGSHMYVYEIRASNNFYDAVTTLDHLIQTPHIMSHEHYIVTRGLALYQSEYSALYRISPSQIHSVTILTLNSDGSVSRTTENNLNYIQQVTRANGGPFRGSDSLPPEKLEPPMVTGSPPVDACFLSPAELEDNPPFAPFLLYMLNNNVFEN